MVLVEADSGILSVQIDHRSNLARQGKRHAHESVHGKIGKTGTLAQFGIFWNFTDHQPTTFADYLGYDRATNLDRKSWSPPSVPSYRPGDLTGIIAETENSAAIGRNHVEDHPEKLPGQRFAITKLADIFRDDQQSVQVARDASALNEISRNRFWLEIQRILLPKHSLRACHFGGIFQLRVARLRLSHLLILAQHERKD